MNVEEPIYVVAGALVDERGRVLIAQRPEGKALAGRWEFPGGKKLPHETPRDALNRELLEEIGVQVARARPLITVRHRYSPDAPPVLIDCWLVDGWRGEIAALDGQALRWCEREELPDADILEADRPIVTALRLPSTFVHAPDPESLAARVPGPASGVSRGGTTVFAGGGASGGATNGRERVAWIVPAMPSDAGVVARLRAHGDAFFALDGTCADALGSVWSSAVAVPRTDPAHRVPLAGVLVASADDARAACAAGADFLLVAERALPDAELAAIAALGLPFYVNVARAGASAVAPTGRLWWKTPIRS